ncbi:lipopolysaccharide biosynthesis protein [Streptomyces sp. NPDC004783]|uniref:lipopolysaccharide biosynthesis protein n=1 Tax=unclassified Streptomyces TaxID=2593676 RepID=UPI0033B8A23C
MTDNPTKRRRRPARSGTMARLAWLAAGTLVGGALGGAYGVVRGPVYTATSYVVAVPSANSDPGPTLGFAQAYGRAATQLAVLRDAQDQAKVPVRTLQRSVRTATSPDAPVIAVSASSRRPGLALGMANGVTDALTRHAEETEENTHVRLVRFAPAVRPTDPSSAPPWVTGAVGASAGGLLVGLVLLVRPRKTEDDPRGLPSVPGPAAAADQHQKV